jgi:hypothetical protein
VSRIVRCREYLVERAAAPLSLSAGLLAWARRPS